MFKALKWLWNDIKTDFIALVEIVKRKSAGKPILREDYKQEWKDTFKNFSMERFLNVTWDIFMIFALGIALGFFLSSHYYAGQAQNAVYDLCQGPLDRGEVICRPASSVLGEEINFTEYVVSSQFPDMTETFK